MIIEKSPYYKSNLEKINSNQPIELRQDKDSEKIDSEDFSFWSWFKGLVNPLQNLPLVSGIYSSVNSENDESDRDLIQNSLGGFLYGGPIGAIAGFGTWAFNKIFNKTPTEMALDATGISSIWKDEDSDNVSGKEFVEESTNPRIIDNNFKLHIQYASSKDFYQERPDKKIVDLASIKTSLVKEPKLTETLNSKTEKPEIIIDNKVDKILAQKQEDLKDIENKLINVSEKKDSVKFREINFTYPEWKPNDKIRMEKKVEDIKKEYQELGEWYMENKNRIRYDA